MPWFDFIEWLGGTITLGAVATAIVTALAWFARGVIGHAFDTKLEVVRTEHKQVLEKIRQDHEKRIAAFENELALLREKASIQYSHLITEQASAIRMLHENVLVVGDALDAYFDAVSGQPLLEDEPQPVNEKRQQFDEALGELMNAYQTHRIYFDQEFENRMLALTVRLISAAEKYPKLVRGKTTHLVVSMFVSLSAQGDGTPQQPEPPMNFDQEISAIKQHLRELEDKLVEYFRMVLGAASP